MGIFTSALLGSFHPALTAGDDLAARVVALYRTRMQVEEGFRDLKSARHGFALRENIGANPHRVANLLLLGALGMLSLWVMGLHGQRSGLVRTLQANTERRRAVLSTFFVGRRLLERRHRFNDAQLSRALALLRQHGHAQALVSTQRIMGIPQGRTNAKC